MFRWTRALVLGMFLAALLASIYIPKPPNKRLDRASLTRMESGIADQPFVRRQLVPLVLRSVDSSMSPSWRALEEQHLRQSPFWGHRLNWTESEGGDLEELECTLLWGVFFTIFLGVLNGEMCVYSGLPGYSPYASLFDAVVCACIFAILHRFSFVYDPPTLTLSALAIREVRKERLVSLAVITALFALNRETAFIVPGFAFFYWMQNSRWTKAVSWGVLLGLFYAVVQAALIYRFRFNSGALAENHRAYLFQVYTHERLPLAAAAVVALLLYTGALIRYWRSLSVVLKAVQWFIPLWVFMHLMWGFPMEWRTFLEVFPAVALTLVALWTKYCLSRARLRNTVVQQAY